MEPMGLVLLLWRVIHSLRLGLLGLKESPALSLAARSSMSDA
jgi:hypothetical protein